jgi:hypothetical protein
MRRICFIFLVLAGTAFWFFSCRSGHRKVAEYEIGYVGFYSSDTARSRERNYGDQVHLKALQRHIERINAANKQNVRYILRPYDCNFDESKIAAIYDSLIANPKTALVIDNTWGRHLEKARDKIREANLPVIALTADKNKNQYGSVLFLEPNDPQPLYLVKFIKEVLKQGAVGFITEYDYLLHQKFRDLVCDKDCWLTLNPLASVSQKLNNDQYKDADIEAAIIPQLDKELENCRDNVLLLNLHSKVGNVVMRYFKKYDKKKFTLIGLQGVTNLKSDELDEISKKGHRIITIDNNSEIFPKELYNEEQALIGHNKKGKYFLKTQDATFAFLKDTDTLFFKDNTYKNQLRRCFDAMNIVESGLQKNVTHRTAFADYFRSLKNAKIALRNELYDFDTSLILRREPTFSERSNGKNRAYRRQINVDGRPIPSLQVGLDILDIGEIDIKKNAFECNLLYWVIADSSLIKYETYIDFDKITANEAKKELIARQYDKDDSSYVVKIYRVSGQFSCDFQAFDFPFDAHEIVVPISALSSSNDLRIYFDYSRLLAKNTGSFNFSDWSPDAYFVTLDNKITNRLGALDKIDTLNQTRYLEKYKSLNVHLAVSRRPWGALILIILPFLMFSMLPLFMLFFHRISFDDIGELIITSFLATVAYSINLVQLSPTTDSLNRAYLFLLLALGINFLSFLYVTYRDRTKTQAEKKAEERRQRRFGRLSIPYMLLLIFILIGYLIFKQ